MQTRGATANTDTSGGDAASTPQTGKVAGGGAGSTRQRSTRGKSKAVTTLAEGEEGDAQNKDEQLPMTPTRRSTRSAARKATELIHDVTDMLSPRKRTASKKPADDVEVEMVTPKKAGKGGATPRSTRGGGRKRGDNDENEAAVDESKNTPVRRGRAAKAQKSSSTDDTVDSTPDPFMSLPPPHPDLESAAKALASLAEWPSKHGAGSPPPSSNSVDEEGFKTPPESPHKAVAAESHHDGEENETFEDAADEISDLSDIDDPHFTAIMSAEAATAAISATGSIAGSIAGESGRESDDDDDEAPEVVTSKAPEAKQKAHEESQEVVAETAAPESAGGDGEASLEQTARAKKKRRARHRKRAVVVEARKNVATALSDLSKRHAQNANALPSSIPEELRLELHNKLVVDPESRNAAKRSAPSAGDKLDASVLAQFAQQTKGNKKRSSSDDVAMSSAERKRARREKKLKRKKDRASRVVSGIKVVASAPTSKADLLQNLAQTVPDSVRRFMEEKHGGNRVKRSDPLVAIARSNKQAAIGFFK
ncbi:hypothetical protein EV175_004585 [Coemansia sp. RSA 1933]|nr:hypothetical protein EV175_004585 [Coemansia sp. RSA 1933]